MKRDPVVVVEGRCAEDVRPRSVSPIVPAIISLFLVFARVAVAQETGISLPTEVLTPDEKLQQWIVALAAALGPTLAFFAAILAAVINARANRKQAERQAQFNRDADDHRAELDRSQSERVRKDESEALAQVLLAEVNMCVSSASAIEELLSQSGKERRAIIFALDLKFSTKAYDIFLDRIGMLGDVTTSLSFFYSNISILQSELERAAKQFTAGPGYISTGGINTTISKDELWKMGLDINFDTINIRVREVRESGKSLIEKLKSRTQAGYL